MEEKVEPRPWDRLPGETPKAYRAFAIYRDEGPVKRSLRSTCEKFYGESVANLRQIEVWSSKYRWVERVAAYDAEMDRIAQQERQEQIADARENARRASKVLQRIGLRALVELADAIDTQHRPPQEPMKYLLEGTRLEWIALGIPFEITKQEISTGPTPEEIEAERRAKVMSNATRALQRERRSTGGS